MSTETPLNFSLPSNKFGLHKIQTKYNKPENAPDHTPDAVPFVRIANNTQIISYTTHLTFDHRTFVRLDKLYGDTNAAPHVLNSVE